MTEQSVASPWNRKLPTGLGKVPLVEAVFELQFLASMPATNVLPGVLFSYFKQHGDVNIVRMHAASISQETLQYTPGYQFVPQIMLELEGYRILVGDRSVSIACKLPYKGGTEFKKFILQVVEQLVALSIVNSIDRYSMKYVDVIPMLSDNNQCDTFELALSLANHKLTSQHASVRMEIPIDGVVNIIQVMLNAQVSLNDGRAMSGGLLDIDSVVFHKTDDVKMFFEELPNRIHDLRMINKATFFHCLTQKAIDSLEPSYGN